MLYTSTDGSIVKALDAATGRLIWPYDPGALGAISKNCCGPNGRGVAVSGGRVFVGTLDGRLIALDAWNGKMVDFNWPVSIEKPNIAP